jgi:HSP20 family protein
VDLYETKDCYVLSAELPGVERDEVHVEVRGSELTIWGERKNDSACCCDENYHRLEGIRGRFCRSFALPGAVAEKANIQATLTNGVLQVEIEKSSRKIAIEPDAKR